MILAYTLLFRLRPLTHAPETGSRK